MKAEGCERRRGEEGKRRDGQSRKDGGRGESMPRDLVMADRGEKERKRR